MKRGLFGNRMRKKLLFLGDSLIEYFDWSKRFPEYEVYDLGIAGETVEGLYSRLRSIFMKVEDPDIVFIMSGINSMAMGDEGASDIYRRVVQEIKQTYPSSKIVVQSLLPVLFTYISNEDIRYMNTSLKQTAADENIDYLDLHSLFLDESGRPDAALLMDDGVHVSDVGYGVWSAAIEQLLRS